MLVLKMNADKSLMITKRGNTYEDENLAEKVKIILPKSINGNDLKDCDTFFCYVNEMNLSNVADISMLVSEYTDDSYVCETDIDNLFTYKAGDLRIWIKILRPNTEDTTRSLVAKSDIVKYTIAPHIDIDATIPPQTFSLLDQLTMKFTALKEEVGDIENKATYDYVDEQIQEIQKQIDDLDESEAIVELSKRIDTLAKVVELLSSNEPGSISIETLQKILV